MVTRVQWTMDDFKEIYARYKESGLTIKDFCSNEGIKHKRNPWFSAQFHPEAASGPTDTEFLFDEFVKLL